MKTLRFTSIILLAASLSGCGPAGPAYTSSVPHTGDKPEIIHRSLFDSKDRTISEDDIQRLLNGKIVIGDSLRVGIFKYSNASIHRYYTSWWTDEEYLKTQQNFVDVLIKEISASGKVAKVIPIPTLMASTEPSMTQLRETAVRLQADILLVYAITSDIYYKYKVFRKNEAKAFATCEAILMDTRTGVIPHSAIITKENLVVKDQQDFSDTETRKQAEQEAVLLTLKDTGKGIADFLDGRK